MMKARLLACPGCARHVRVSESACPFCGSALTEAFARALAPRKPTVRLTRAALYAFGATSLTVAAACGTSGGGTTDSGSDHMAVAAYGAPCLDGGCGLQDNTVPEAGNDGSGADGAGDELIAAYGGPPDGFGAETSPESGPADGHTG